VTTTFFLGICGGDSDCRCPKVHYRPELGDEQAYCGKELKGNCANENRYICVKNRITPKPRTLYDISPQRYRCAPKPDYKCDAVSDCARERHFYLLRPERIEENFEYWYWDFEERWLEQIDLFRGNITYYDP